MDQDTYDEKDLLTRAEAERGAEAAFESQACLAALMAGLGDGVVIYDGAGRITGANQAARQMLGLGADLSAAAGEGQARLQTADGDDLPPERWPMRRALAGETVRGEIITLCTPWRNPPSMRVAAGAVPILGPDGAWLGAVATFSDITRLQAAESALAAADARQRQAAQEMERRVDERTAQLQELAADLARREAALREAYTALAESRRQAQVLSRRLVAMQEQERHTLAAQLQDDANQLLASLSVGLRVLERRYPASAEARSHIQYLIHTADEVLERIHRLGADLRPVSLDKLGLLPAVRQCVEQFGRANDVRVSLATAGLSGLRLAPDTETGIYRIVEEALANVARHAHASDVGVVLTRRADAITVIVEDNGVGLDPAQATNGNQTGLLSMRERAEMIGGVLTVEGQPGTGTTVYLEIPFSEEDRGPHQRG